MRVEVVLLPGDLKSGSVTARIPRTFVVFDVLRATTTMTAALAAGVREIRLFDSIEALLEAAPNPQADCIRCGERKCLWPAGFELGNSPGGFNATHRDKTVFMATTNGTKAILAARAAVVRLAGALVNASAVAEAAAGFKYDVTLLCAGTGGAVAMEDMIGAGAVAEAMIKHGGELDGDAARMAVRLFRGARGDLVGALSDSEGGRNVIAAGLREDIEFAARLDSIQAVGVVEQEGEMTVLRKA